MHNSTDFCLVNCRYMLWWLPDLSTSYGGSLRKQVWTGLQWWLPGVTSRFNESHVWCLGRPVEVGGGLYSEVQCIMGDGHVGPLIDGMTDRHNWKHYLPATSLAASNSVDLINLLPEMHWNLQGTSLHLLRKSLARGAITTRTTCLMEEEWHYVGLTLLRCGLSASC